MLTEQVLTRGPLTSLDLAFAHWLSGHGPRHPLILTLAQDISRLATPQWTVAGSLVLAAAMSRRARTWQPLQHMTAAMILLTAAVLGMKTLIDRPGPRGTGAAGYFPSGHTTTTAVVCAGTLLLLADQHWPRLRRIHLPRLVALWALLVGWAMTWHNYHWLTDVLAAWLLGALILATPARGLIDGLLRVRGLRSRVSSMRSYELVPLLRSTQGRPLVVRNQGYPAAHEDEIIPT